MMWTDEQLMCAVTNGELEHFGALFERHYQRVFAFFYRLTGDASSSEDLAQEVFVRMLKYRNGFGPDSQFRAWMYQIARNVRADHFGRRQSERVLLQDVQVISNTVDPLENFERLSLLQRALLALPED